MTPARALPWLLAALAFAPRALLAYHDLPHAIAADLVQDDPFYYFVVARNLLAGLGPSFDGVSATNAFHPLFMAIVVACVALFPGELNAPVQAANLVLAAAAAGTTRLLFGWLEAAGSRRAAIVAALLFALSPYFVVHTTNALETGLALCAALAVLRAYQAWVLPALPDAPSAARSIAFGALCGLAVLARIDAALLLVCLALDWAWRAHAGITRARLQRAGLATLAALLVWLPWGIGSRATTGAWLPTSGAASREIALQLGWTNLRPIWNPDLAGQRTFRDGAQPDRVPPAWFADVFTKQIAVQALEQPLLAPLRANVPYAVWPPLTRYAPFRWTLTSPVTVATGLVAGLAASLALAIAARARRRAPGSHPDAGSFALGRPALLAVAAWSAGYTFYAPTHWYFARYFVLPVLLVLGLGLLWLARACEARDQPARPSPSERPRRGWQSLFAAGGAVLVLFEATLGLRFAAEVASSPANRGFLAAWQRLSPALPPAATLGAFQSGVYGWFGDRPVVNLDGKVNPQAQHALANGELARYVDERGVDFVIDWESMLHALVLRHMSADERKRLRFEEVARERERGGVVLWRVQRRTSARERR